MILFQHLFRDPSSLLPPAPAQTPLIRSSALTLDIRGSLLDDPEQNLENVHLNSEKVAEAELIAFWSAGGRVLLDTTVASLGRNPRALRRLAKATNVSIVMGCGFSVASTHPTWLAAESQDSIASMMERELEGGTVESDEEGRLRSGFIGGIGISAVPHEVELRVLRASVHVAVKSGAPLFIEPAYLQSGQEPRAYLDGILDVICREVLLARPQAGGADQSTGGSRLQELHLVLLRCGYLCEVGCTALSHRARTPRHPAVRACKHTG